jgi:uncharacterized Zn finger protein (UPF0148 family)
VELRRITEIPCLCPNMHCGWEGLTGDCESGKDGDLVCPRCNKFRVLIQYNEHERNPK